MTTERITRAEPVLSLVRNTEASPAAQKAQGVTSPYDVVWGKIRSKDRTKAPISQLTVQQVLNWQDILDPFYMSEAAGAYQILEDTLRTLHFDPRALFNKATQDDLALQLMDDVGWSRCEAGDLDPSHFADNLSHVWASFPVMFDQVVRNRAGKVIRILRRGQSYYAGDKLNRALITPQQVLYAVHQALAIAPIVTKPAELKPDEGWTPREASFLKALMTWASEAPSVTPEAVQESGAVDNVLTWARRMPKPEEAAQ